MNELDDLTLEEMLEGFDEYLLACDFPATLTEEEIEELAKKEGEEK